VGPRFNPGAFLLARWYSVPVPDEVPTIGDAVEEVVLNKLPPDIVPHFAQFKREFKEDLDEAEARYKRAKKWLKQRKAKPEEYEALEEEYRQLVSSHRDRLQRRIRQLLSDYLPE
jgi:hypothetical protein